MIRLRHLLLLPLLFAPGFAADTSLFDQSNLAAWCIVPFDKGKRGPEERAAMLEKLKLGKFVYDYRAEHVPTFDAELEALKRHHIELLGWWFPTKLNDEAKMTLELFKRHNVKPQLWISGGGEFPKNDAEMEQRYLAEVARVKPIAEAAQAQGLKVGLYNHGGWFGEPETQIEIIKRLGMSNVGMVYNLHHGHDHVRRLEQLLKLMVPHLICLNLNGMMEDGERRGMKIVPLGQGGQDLDVLKLIATSGYRGPVGILNHTSEDAEERLRDNLDGLRWLVKQLKGEPAGAAPKPKSWTLPPPPKPKASAQGPAAVPSLNEKFGKALSGRFDAGEKPAYRERPFTIECRAKLDSKNNFNILVARDAKNSADHWELYTFAKTGCLSLYQPGRGGSINSKAEVCDGKWHHLAAVVEETRVRLYVDGNLVTDAAATPLTGKVKEGGLSIGSLVEGGIGCDGVIDEVRLSKGAREIGSVPDAPLKADATTLELWNFDTFVGAIHTPEDSKPAPNAASFFYQFAPLQLELWPHRDHWVNHYRLYDFYTKEALAFRDRKPTPALLPAHPGLEGGLFGHWGYANDEHWKDARWRDADRKPVQAGILFTSMGTYPKAVVMQLGDHEELTTFFDPLTLSFPAVTGGSFVKMGDSRHGMMEGLRLIAPIGERPQAPKLSDHAVYHGYYRHGARLIFSYQNGGQEILSSAWADQAHFTLTTAPRGDEPLASLTKGGPAQWPRWLETKGTLGTRKPYTVDTLTLPAHPQRHPWFVSGCDFFSDGTAAICTMTGDVWLVRGIDDKLQKLRWKRFASGLSQPLGLKIVDGKVCVQGRDQITRLHDLNSDDEADFYECVSNAQKSSPSGHDFITGCEFDGTYFYFASGNEGVCRVKPGSREVEVVSTGFRNPNGLGLAADGTVTTSVQEGEWTPTSAICQLTPGGFFGAGGPKPGKTVLPPLCYLPRGVDNSSGGQCFTQSDRWGPLGGQLIHFSPGTANHFLVLRQKVADVTQGAVVWLPGDFLSGAQQGRINPKDGQLYVTGMYGWGCYGSEAGSLERVRYTGGPAHLPVAFAAHENGVLITFSDPLGSVAQEVKNHFAQCWNYRYSAAYGSPEFSVRHPDTEGHDSLEITGAHVIDGGKSLFLEIPLLTPCNQVHVHVGTVESQYQNLYITAHKLAPAFTQFPGYQPKPKQFIVADKASAQAVARINPWAAGKRGRELKVQAALGLKYAQPALTAKAGERLSVTFSNPDVVPHNWALIMPGKLNEIGDATNKLIADPNGLAHHYIPESSDVICYTDMVNPGGSFTINFKAPDKRGTYPYLCTFPGHWLVMNGVLKVE